MRFLRQGAYANSRAVCDKGARAHFFASTIKHSSVRICMWKPIASKTKRSFFRRMRGRNVSSTHPAGETTIVDTLLFLVACANYSAIGRKTEKRESALTSQSGFCGIPPRYPLEIKVKDNRERRIFDFLSKVSNPPRGQPNKEFASL